MITVTSKSGKTVEMMIVDATVVAKVAGMEFPVAREGGKIQSRWLVREAGNRRVEIALECGDLILANALFDELDMMIARSSAAAAEHDRRHEMIINKMQGE